MRPARRGPLPLSPSLGTDLMPSSPAPAPAHLARLERVAVAAERIAEAAASLILTSRGSLPLRADHEEHRSRAACIADGFACGEVEPAEAGEDAAEAVLHAAAIANAASGIVRGTHAEAEGAKLAASAHRFAADLAGADLLRVANAYADALGADAVTRSPRESLRLLRQIETELHVARRLADLAAEDPAGAGPRAREVAECAAAAERLAAQMRSLA